MIAGRGDLQGPCHDIGGSAGLGDVTATRVPSTGLRVVPSADELLLQRCARLMDVLAAAQDEMASALMAGDVVLACAAGRRLASVGWQFRDAADRHRDGLAQYESEGRNG